MSNLIKSGFVAFSKEDAVVIDANKNHIIESIDGLGKMEMAASEETEEEALAAALIRDVGLDEVLEDDESAMLFEKSLNISENEAKTKAEEILASARQEADDIVNCAHEEAEQMHSVAYDEAIQIKQQAKEEGYQEGYSEGKEQADLEYGKKKAQLDEKMIENEQIFVDKEKRLIEQTEHKMVDVLCQLIPTITGISIENERNVLLYMINMAMHDLDNSTKFVIRVSSNDYGALLEQKDKIYGALNPNIELEIFEDAKLQAMQCLIDTDNGIVDISLDVQLNNLIKALKLMI
ncbi:MAG: FliH/SctL family protein [Clostridiales bacterium]|nr:FliH/SctL family protein [Clostridiales bacterium]